MELYPPIIIHYKYYFLSSYGNLNLILSLMIYNYNSIQIWYKLIGKLLKIMSKNLCWKNTYFQNFVIFLLLEAFSRIFFIVKLVFGCFEACSYHGLSIKLTRITRQFNSFKIQKKDRRRQEKNPPHSKEEENTARSKCVNQSYSINKQYTLIYTY